MIARSTCPTSCDRVANHFQIEGPTVVVVIDDEGDAGRGREDPLEVLVLGVRAAEHHLAEHVQPSVGIEDVRMLVQHGGTIWSEDPTVAVEEEVGGLEDPTHAGGALETRVLHGLPEARTELNANLFAIEHRDFPP